MTTCIFLIRGINIETHPPYEIDEIGIANLINDLNGIMKNTYLKTYHLN